MERYLIHLKNEKFIPINSREILYRARDLITDTDAHIRLCRVATKFIEFDVAIETKDVDELVEKLSPIGELDNLRHVEEEEIEIDQGIKDGIFQDTAIGIHEFSALLSYIVIAIHVSAAIYSRIKGEGVWSSMVPILNKETPSNNPIVVKINSIEERVYDKIENVFKSD